MKKYPSCLIFGLLCCFWAPLRAQTVTSGPDSARVNQAPPATARTDSAKLTERLFGLRLTRPGKAALLALVPGGGQIYNKRWWKLPLVYGLLGGLGYGEYFYQTRFRQYVDERDLRLGDPSRFPNGNPNSNAPVAERERSVQNLESGIIFYRRNRDIFILYLTLGYALQIVDAVVDAHLREFDVSDDLSLRWDPALLPVPGQLLPALGASVALRVK